VFDRLPEYLYACVYGTAFTETYNLTDELVSIYILAEKYELEHHTILTIRKLQNVNWVSRTSTAFFAISQRIYTNTLSSAWRLPPRVRRQRRILEAFWDLCIILRILINIPLEKRPIEELTVEEAREELTELGKLSKTALKGHVAWESIGRACLTTQGMRLQATLLHAVFY